MVGYQLLDPRYRTYLLHAGPGGTEYLVGWPPPIAAAAAAAAAAAIPRHASATRGYHQTNGLASASGSASPGQTISIMSINN